MNEVLNFIQPKDAWDKLSMREKAEMMKVAVRNGIYNLNDIREKYNEFAKGGDTDTDRSYNSWKKQIAEHMGIRPDEDNTYDYEAYFNKYPEEAWKMLKGDPTAHFSDEFKTVYHPTFSSKSIGNDGSIYSGVRNPKTNPQGLIGGTWSPDYHTFTMSPDGYRGPVSMDDRKWYLENAEDNGVQLREADGSLPIYDGIPWGGVLPNVTVYGTRHSLGGPLVEAANEYRHGGGIHIKKENRGKFTRLKERTGHSASWFKEHGTPAQKKMAVFELNARKWKHGLGGNLYEPGGWLSNVWDWLKNAAQVGAIAESPAVMTAAGHRVDRGKAVQDKQSSVEVKQLRENLANFGEGALGAITATGDIEAVYNAARHPVQTARAIKNGIKEIRRLSANKGEQSAIKADTSTSSRKHFLSEEEINSALQAAKDYKNSEKYRQLVQNSIEESKKIGTGEFPEETFFTGIHEETPKVIIEARPENHVASYNYIDNTMRFDPNQILEGEQVPYHEALHWQRLGKPEINIGPKYEKWSNSLVDGTPENESINLFTDFYNSPEYTKYLQRENAENFIKEKVANVLYDNVAKDSEMRKPGELIAHTMEAGKAQGIKPFSEYPGYKKAIDAIDNARKYDSYLYDIKAGSEAEVINFWKLLSGNYIPSVIFGGISTKILKD